MNVIRHHAPVEEFVSLTVEMQQCILHRNGNVRSAQEALAMPGIEDIAFEPVRASAPLFRPADLS